MLTVSNPANHYEIHNIDFSNILSLKEIDSGSIVSFRSKKGIKKNFLSNLKIDSIRELIVSNKESLFPHFRSFEYRMNPVISP